MLRTFTLTGLAALALLTPGRSLAHAVQTDVSSLLPSGLINLRTSFSSGEPLANAPVRLESHDGSQSIELGATDADGRLRIDLSDVADGVLDLQVDGGPGHRDYLELPVSSGQVDLDQVVSLPFTLVLVGLLVNVRRRSD